MKHGVAKFLNWVVIPIVQLVVCFVMAIYVNFDSITMLVLAFVIYYSFLGAKVLVWLGSGHHAFKNKSHMGTALIMTGIAAVIYAFGLMGMMHYLIAGSTGPLFSDTGTTYDIDKASLWAWVITIVVLYLIPQAAVVAAFYHNRKEARKERKEEKRLIKQHKQAERRREAY